MTTKSEKAHLARVAEMGCALCEHIGLPGIPAQVHHLRAENNVGMGQRASTFLTIPLCETHHTGPRGIHGDRSSFKNARVDELDLLAMVIQKL